MNNEKNRKKKRGLILILAGIACVLTIITLCSALYSVHPNETVAVKRFGAIIDTVSEPGLHIKAPFICTTQRISHKTKIYDLPLSDVITKDKKTMIADSYVLWHITTEDNGPEKYIRTLNGIDLRAEERIEASVYNALKTILSGMDQNAIIEARGDKLSSMLVEEANSDIGQYGIRIDAASIKALDLPDANKQAVYERMKSERQKIAMAYKAEGEAEAQKIRNETDRKVTVLLADAQKNAEITIAEGEAEYMRILQNAYGTPEKADFYCFLRSLDALKITFSSSKDKIIILDKDSELARILYGMDSSNNTN